MNRDTQLLPPLNRVAAALLSLLLVAFVPQAHAAITTNGTPASVASDSADTLPGFTVAAGTDRLLIVFVHEESTDSITDVTFNGSSLTFLGGRDEGGFSRMEAWFTVLGSGAAITSNIVMTNNDADADSFASVVAAVAYDGVDQGTPIDGFVSNSGFNVAAVSNTVTSAAGDLVVGAAFNTASGGALSAGAGQIPIHTHNDIFGDGNVHFMSSREAGAASVVMNYTAGNFDLEAISLAFNINNAGAVVTAPEIAIEFDVSNVEIPDGDATPSGVASEGTNFGNLDTATGSVTRTFEIFNRPSATANLNLTGPNPVTVTGGAGHYGVTQPGSLVLAPGASTTFTVTYDPTADGAHPATIHVASDDADEADYDFAVSGIGSTSSPSLVTVLGTPASTAGDNENTHVNFTVGAGGNRLLVVYAFEEEAEGTTNLNSVTFDGTPMTLGGAVKLANGQMQLEIWYLAMGTGGAVTGDIVISATGGADSFASIIAGVAFENVDQTTPADGFVSAFGTASDSTLLVTSEAGDRVVTAHVNRSVGGGGPFDPVAGSGQVVLHEHDALVGGFTYFVSSTEPGGAIVDSLHSWGGSQDFVTAAMNLNASTAPAIAVNTTNLVNTSTSMTINGFNFDLTPGNNVVVFTPPGTTGTVTASTATTLTVTGLAGLVNGPLSAVVTTPLGNTGAATQVATVVDPPATTEVTLSGGVLAITDVDGGNTNDDLTISFAGGTLTIIDNNAADIGTVIAGSTGSGTATVTVPDTGVTSITFDTLGGDDKVTINFAPGNFATLPITYNGGTHTLGDELLFVSAPGTPTVTPGAPGNGTIAVTGNALITYTNVEKVPGGAPTPVASALGDATTGSGAPDAAGTGSVGTFDLLKRGGFLGDNGSLVFPGELLIGSGAPPVTLSPNTFMGLWKDDGSGLKLLARSGDLAPESGGAAFDILPSVPAINDSGEVTFLGSLALGAGTPLTTTDNDTGLWSELGGTGLQILMREDDDIPGLAGVKVGRFISGAFATADTGGGTGQAAFCITMKGASTDTAILRTSIIGTDTTAVAVIARQNTASPGGLGNYGGLASSYTDSMRMDAAGNLIFTALVGSPGKEALFSQPTGAAVALEAAAGNPAPGTGGATFKSIKSPAIGSGQLSFRGFLNTDGDNAANDKNDGIWRGPIGGPLVPILRRGDAPVAGMAPGSLVGNVWGGWLNNNNHGAWRAWYDVDGDGLVSSVANGDVQAIFTDINGAMEMAVKVGDAAPGIPGATFASMDLPIVGSDAVGGVEWVAFIGKVTGGGTTAGVDDQGIWRKTDGGAFQLVIRAGDTLTTSGGVKTIQKLDFPGSGSTDRRWEQPVMDNTGRLLIYVKFTDGSTSQVLAP